MMKVTGAQVLVTAPGDPGLTIVNPATQSVLWNDRVTYEREVDGQFVGLLVVFGLALIPNPLFDATGMAAGALRFPVWKYLTAAGLGKVLKNILFAFAGSLGIGWLSGLFGG